jgi:SAM-dependent methyltransferase
MIVENGIVVGSNGKYDTKNPIARYLLDGFDRAILDSLNECSGSTVLEIGCGEGHVTDLILSTGVSKVLATDISTLLVEENTARSKDSRVTFEVADMMTFAVSERFDVVICCEVLEHLDDPVRGLEMLHNLGAREYVFSVPREPIWRIMNMARGSYWSEFGNSPGHVNHFSQRAFIQFVEQRFIVHSLRAPVPWTIIRCKPK